MKRILYFVACLAGYVSGAQSVAYSPKTTNWHDAGYYGAKPTFSHIINILNFSADTTGAAPANASLIAAIQALNGSSGVIYFPAGTYYFNAAIAINSDSIIFRGAGYNRTQLRFDLAGQVSNLIQITGASTNDTAQLTATAVRGTSTTNISNDLYFQPGDWVTLSMNDQAYMTSSWAYGSLSQQMQVQSVHGHELTFRSPFRFDYFLANNPGLRKVIPRNNIGFECLKIQRMDATAGQASNLVFENAVNCWVNGIESDSANFAHIEVNHSSNIEVSNSYFHHAFAYGGNGQGYGVLLQFGSNECKVTANYFDHLRHSMLLQAGANGNVLAYNYSTNPFWTEPYLPDSSAGDLVLHGNYPFMNLAEGNFIRNIVIDDSHGKNGPLNTFFRNRAEGYGIFMNFNPPTDTVQFIANEVTNTSTGLYFLNGNGHIQYGNKVQGTITGGGELASATDASLYLPQGQKPPCADGYDAWPVVGRNGGYNTGIIEAKNRVAAGRLAACNCTSISQPTGITNTKEMPVEWTLYPNPADQEFRIEGAGILDRVEIYSMTGSLVFAQDKPAGKGFAIDNLAPGMYLVRMINGNAVVVKRLIKA